MNHSGPMGWREVCTKVRVLLCSAEGRTTPVLMTKWQSFSRTLPFLSIHSLETPPSWSPNFSSKPRWFLPTSTTTTYLRVPAQAGFPAESNLFPSQRQFFLQRAVIASRVVWCLCSLFFVVLCLFSRGLQKEVVCYAYHGLGAGWFPLFWVATRSLRAAAVPLSWRLATSHIRVEK